jgi:hypothetical protein
MLHFAAMLRCPFCRYDFPVCIRAEAPPPEGTTYVFRCPKNNSPLRISVEHFRLVDCCPEGAVEGREWRPNSTAAPASPVPGSTGRRWWQFWK